MARDLESVVKRSRREGYALHPKAHKALVKRTSVPGQHGGRNMHRAKASQYSLQLREKQKVKRLYGLLEKQFAKLMEEALRSKGQSGDRLMEFLERRLDNVVYRAGFATSRRGARQLVTHGHFKFNDRRVDIPSIRVDTGNVISLRDASKKGAYFKHLDDLSPAPAEIPSWIKVDRSKLEITINSMPTRDDAEPEIKDQLIVEYYSR
ncbi:MAG TPA: 30S ribosomal protein S4 [Candidatus Saccharimonadales bacterium]|nr:30S ribosomal protein S4 [Candidatus Saccharimonadales bacterium]